MSDTPSPDAQAVMTQLGKMQGPPYQDDVSRLSGLSAPAFQAATGELVSGGILTRSDAPGGTLLYLTVRGFQLAKELQTPLLRGIEERPFLSNPFDQ